MIAVIASMPDELRFTDSCTFISREKINIFDCAKYEYNGEIIVTGVCGTGKVSAALCTFAMIKAFDPNLIISIGTSGSLEKSVRINDIVIATGCIQHDFDVSPFGYKKGELCELRTVELKAEEEFLTAAHKALDENSSVHFGTVLSGDKIIVSEEDKKTLTSEFGGLCCEMEVGGIAQTCALCRKQFAAVKGISDGDYEEEARNEEFRSNIDSSSLNCGDALLKIISVRAEGNK